MGDGRVIIDNSIDTPLDLVQRLECLISNENSIWLRQLRPKEKCK
jgi:hypothetical protein